MKFAMEILTREEIQFPTFQPHPPSTPASVSPTTGSPVGNPLLTARTYVGEDGMNSSASTTSQPFCVPRHPQPQPQVQPQQTQMTQISLQTPSTLVGVSPCASSDLTVGKDQDLTSPSKW